MFNLFLGIILFIGLIVFAIFSGGSIETFMDMPSLIIVVVGALIYSFSSGGDATDWLDNDASLKTNIDNSNLESYTSMMNAFPDPLRNASFR